MFARYAVVLGYRLNSPYIFSLESSCFGFQYDAQAFLFSLVNMPGWAPVKFDQTGQYSSFWYSTYSCYSYGPTFGGGHDLQVGHPPYNYYSNLGYTYSPPSGYSFGSSFAQSFLAGSYKFHPDEVETFYDANITSQGRLKDKRYYIYNFFFRNRK